MYIGTSNIGSKNYESDDVEKRDVDNNVQCEHIPNIIEIL